MPPHRQTVRPGRTSGRRAARAFVALVAAGLALACGVGSAQASAGPAASSGLTQADAATPGLHVTLTGAETAPQMVLTNNSSAPCQVPDAALGAVNITQVTQGGKTIQPVPATAWFDDSVPDYLGSQLRTLAPGQSLTVPMPVVTTAKTGTALETASWSGPDTSTAALFPIKAGQPIQIWMNYAAAVVVTGGVPLCSGSDTSAKTTLAATAAANGSSSSGKIAGIPRKTLIYAVAGVIVLLLLALFVFLRVRKRKSSAVTNAMVILALVACGLTVSTASAPPASAKVVLGSPNLSKDFKTCMALFAGAGGDPSNIMSTDQGPNVTVNVVDAKGDENHEIQLLPGQLQIFWDPSDTHEYVGGGNADKCTTLYHELDHAYQDLTTGQVYSHCWTPGPDGKLKDSGLPTNEVQASREQNMLRSNLGLQPRKTYGGIPLPDGTCQPPPPPPPGPQKVSCAGQGCGDTNGDPHLYTFQGFRYDFQAAGEFVAVDDPAGGFQVQVRQQAFPGSQTIAVNTAIALDVAGDRLQVGIDGEGLSLLVNGKAQSDTTTKLPHGGTTAIGYASTGQTMTVTWPDSSTAVIGQISVWGLHLSVRPAADHVGKLRGLLGNLVAAGDTTATTGVQAADGSTLTQPTFSKLYPAYADGWRVTNTSSLFTYAPGTNTATFTDPSFPHAPATITSIPSSAATAAAAQCASAGVTDPVTLENCEFDVGLTGQSAFADADALSQPEQPTTLPPTQNGGAFGIGGGPATVTITKPGGSTTLQFNGIAGQVVFVNVPKSTLPNQCGVIELKDPIGKEVTEGCIINGTGFIPTATLPLTGTYTVLVGPTDSGTGSATLQLIQDFNQTGTITPDGPPVTATIAQPGAISTFTFTAAPGTSVFVQVVSATLANQCGIPTLLDPTGGELATGCSINQAGDIAETTLKSGGTYKILVDPSDPGIGNVVFKLIVDHDQTAPITIGGPPVTSVIAKPGEKSSLTFQATAGQSVSVQASGSTLPNTCGILELDGPDGKELASDCIVNGTGSVPTVKLPTTGQYTIRLDPGDGKTGSTVVRLIAG